MIDLQDVRRTPYALEGRAPGVGLDCLGVCLVVAARLGIPSPDPWCAIAEDWRRGLAVSSGFPAGWARFSRAEWRRPETGDVWVFVGAHPWVGILCDGYLWSASAAAGVFSVPACRWQRAPNEVWRHERARARAPRPTG
jgi:hypothetical protein